MMTISSATLGSSAASCCGYTVTQIAGGMRVSIPVIAINGRAAVDAVRAMTTASPSQQVAA